MDDDMTKRLNEKFDEIFKPLEEDDMEDMEVSEATEDDLDNIIILSDESGNDVKFEFLDLVEYQGNEYVVLAPAEIDDESAEVVILKVEDVDDSDNESYESVEDEKILNAVFEIFKNNFMNEFNFTD